MKTKISRVGKRALSVVLTIMLMLSTMLIGMVSVNATINVGSNCLVYFDNTNSKWDKNVYLFYGTDNNWLHIVKLSKIDGTNLYGGTTSSEWNGCNYFAFFEANSSGWSSHSSNWSTLNNDSDVIHLTYGVEGNLSKDNTYIYKGAYSSTKNSTVTFIKYFSNINYNENMNYTQTLKTKVAKYGSADYAETSTQIAPLTITSFKFDGNTTTTNSDNSGGATAQTDAAYTALTKFTYGEVASGYTFKGWYNSVGDELSTGATYEFRPTSAGDYYAYFEEQTPPVASGVSLTASPASGYTNEPITLTANITGLAAASADVTFACTSGEDSFTSGASQTVTADGEVTAVYTPTASGSHTFTVTASATGYKSVTSEVSTVDVKDRDTYYLVGGTTSDSTTKALPNASWSLDDTSNPFTWDSSENCYYISFNNLEQNSQYEFKINPGTNTSTKSWDVVYGGPKDTKLVFTREAGKNQCDWKDLTAIDGGGNIVFTTDNAGSYTIKFDAASQTKRVTIVYPAAAAKPSVALTGTSLTDEQIVVGADVKLTAAVTPAKDADGNNVTGEYTVEFYKGGTSLGTKKVNVAADSTTVTASYNTQLSEVPATYTAKAYPTANNTNMSDLSNELTYVQKYPNKIYFDPTNMNDWRTFIQDEAHTSPTIKMTISDTALAADEKEYTMQIDPGFQFAKDKGVFVAKISDAALASIKSGKTISFEISDPSIASTITTDATGQADVKDGSILTFDYSGTNSTLAKKWSDYNTADETGFPKGCTTYKEFTEYLATNTTKDVVYFDNSATQWYNVYIYSWNLDGGVQAQNAFGAETVKMKRLKNFSDIWYFEMPTGKTVPDGNFLFKDRSNDYANNTGIFGYDYQQSVDLVKDSVIRGKSSTDNDMYFEDMEFDITKTVDAYQTDNGLSTELHNPIFITAQYANVTIRTNLDDSALSTTNAKNYYDNSMGDKDIKNRAFAYGWSDLYGNVVSSAIKTAPVTVYFDLHGKATGNSTMELYHSVRSGFSYGSLPAKTTLRRLGTSTIYAATIQLPYNEESSLLAFTFDKFVIGSTGYAMGASAQPAFKCINTGEVWYEIKSNIDGTNQVLTSGAKAAAIASGAKNEAAAAGATGTFKLHIQLSSSESVMLKTYGNGDNYIFNWVTGTDEGNGYYLVTNSSIDYTSIINSATGIQLQTSNIAVKEYVLANNPDIKTAMLTGEVWATKTSDGWSFSSTDPTGGSGGTTPTGAKTLYVTGDQFGWGTWEQLDQYTADGSIAYIEINTNKLFKVSTTSAYITDYTGLSINNTLGDVEITGELADGEGKDLKAGTTDGTAYLCVNASGEIYAQSTNPGTVTAPSITLNPETTTITLSKGSASVDLKPTVLNATAEPSYEITTTDGDLTKASVTGGIFTSQAAGTYTVTATITVDTKDYTATANIKVNEEAAIVDVCGILAYEHATAEFSSTTGGVINSGSADSPRVMLTNGYYSTGEVATGYTVLDGSKYVTIYALAKSVRTEASASFKAVTSIADASSNYKFAGWKKNGLTMSAYTTEQTMTDALPSTASTVSYVANWSEIQNVTWTFTYNWNRFDRSANGWEYKNAETDVYVNETYTATAVLPEDLTKSEIIEQYVAYAPKVDDDYFGYSFSNSDETAYTYDATNHTVAITATKSNAKTYQVTITKSGTGALTPDIKACYYQAALTLTDDTVIPEDKVLVWKNEATGKVLGTGSTLNFRVTDDINIATEFVDKATYVAKPYTTVSKPTYEAYVRQTDGQNRVRMNFRVDNYIFGNNVTEYGVLYFFCSSDGTPVDSTISNDSTITEAMLKAAANGTDNGITRKVIDSAYVNNQQKYLYQPTLSLTDANKKRYLRMFSYFKYTDSDGKAQIVISDPASTVIGSIGEFAPVI